MMVTSYEPATQGIDVVHTGPGTLAGRFMRSFWQPVALARELEPRRAKPLHVMNEQFTLYRGESGAPYLVGFRCAHRGTQLSASLIEDERIRCLYHGWQYDGTGQCVDMPATEEPSFRQKVRI